MGKYKLCLIYSSNFYKPILEETFNSISEIDDITAEFESEKSLRADKEMFKKINKIQNENWKYITAIEDKQKQNGKIAIVDLESEEFSYFKPLYKNKIVLKSPKKLSSSIINALKNENDGKVLSRFFDKFKKYLNTEYARISGIFKYNDIIKHTEVPETSREKIAYKNMLDIIKLTITHQLDKEKDSMKESVYIYQRKMLDYLGETEYIKNLKVRNTKKIEKGKINKEKSKEIVSEADLYRKLMEQAYNDSLERGEEPNLLGIYDEKYKEELERLNYYFDKRRRK